MNDIKISTIELAHWFNAIRNISPNERTRALDAFWSGQLDSKKWLVSELNKIVLNTSNVYIFGGWIGVLANMILTNSSYNVSRVRSIDLDPWCEIVADNLNKIHEMDSWRFKARTANMADYEYEFSEDGPIIPHIVVNTSCEHIDQSVYDQWYSKIPNGSLVAVQSNDYFDCLEHIRCNIDLDDFSKMNRVNEPLFIGSMETEMYTRFMAIWIK
jgi:hypothetical protein